MMHSDSIAPEGNNHDDAFLPNSVDGDDILLQLSGSIGDNTPRVESSQNGKSSTQEGDLSGNIGDSGSTTDNTAAAKAFAEKMGRSTAEAGSAIRSSILSGKLPQISVAQLVPKVEFHKMRGPSLFFGISQYVDGDDSTRAFSIPDCTAVYARVKSNFAVFSANYMALSLFIAVCFSLTNITFIISMLLLAVMWNWVLQTNAQEPDSTNPQDDTDPLNAGGDLEMGIPAPVHLDGETDSEKDGFFASCATSNKAMRMLGAYGVTALVLWLFASSLLWQIMLYSAVIATVHAVFRNNYRYVNCDQGQDLEGGVSAVPSGDFGGSGTDQMAQMQMMAQAGAAFGALSGMAQKMGVATTSSGVAPPVTGREVMTV